MEDRFSLVEISEIVTAALRDFWLEYDVKLPLKFTVVGSNNGSFSGQYVEMLPGMNVLLATKIENGCDLQPPMRMEVTDARGKTRRFRMSNKPEGRNDERRYQSGRG